MPRWWQHSMMRCTLFWSSAPTRRMSHALHGSHLFIILIPGRDSDAYPFRGCRLIADSIGLRESGRASAGPGGQRARPEHGANDRRLSKADASISGSRHRRMTLHGRLPPHATGISNMKVGRLRAAVNDPNWPLNPAPPQRLLSRSNGPFVAATRRNCPWTNPSSVLALGAVEDAAMISRRSVDTW